MCKILPAASLHKAVQLSLSVCSLSFEHNPMKFCEIFLPLMASNEIVDGHTKFITIIPPLHTQVLGFKLAADILQR